MRRPNHPNDLLRPILLSAVMVNTLLMWFCVRTLMFNTLIFDAFVPILRAVLREPGTWVVLVLAAIYLALVWWAWWLQLASRRRRNSRLSVRSLDVS